MDYGFITEIKKFKEKNLNDNLKKNDEEIKKILEKVAERKKGKTFSINEHLRAIIYSLLGNQRPWKRIEENRGNIDKIFFKFDVNSIKKKKAEYFIKSLINIKCGNRNIHKQMNGLKCIINVLENISQKYGEIDNYYNNHPKIKEGYPYYLAKELSDKKNEYKLKNMGIALICEYFKSIGIDIAKPDIHITRMFGKDILGFSKTKEATSEEAIRYIKEIADESGFSQIEVDQALWEYCADGYLEICTKDKPKCDDCVIRKYCNKNRALSM